MSSARPPGPAVHGRGRVRAGPRQQRDGSRSAGRPEAEAGWLLDGYPRTLAQVPEMDDIAESTVRPLDAVVVLDVDEELVRRSPRLFRRGPLRCEFIRPSGSVLLASDPVIVAVEVVLAERRVATIVHVIGGRVVGEVRNRGPRCVVDRAGPANAV